MKADEFWLMVQTAHRDQRDEGPDLARLTQKLQRLGEPEISAFERHVKQQLENLDTAELKDVATQLWVISDDSWLQFRGWCVSQGREFVAQLVAQPGAALRAVASEGAGPFDVPNGDLFLYCAEYARVARAKAVA